MLVAQLDEQCMMDQFATDESLSGSLSVSKHS